MIIFDLNFVESNVDSHNIKGGIRKRTEIPRQSFADAQAFSFVDDSTDADYETEEIQVSASTFALVELGHSSAASNSFGLFKGG